MGYLLPNGNGTARACGDNAEGRIPRLRGRNHRTGERYDGLVSRVPAKPREAFIAHINPDPGAVERNRVFFAKCAYWF